MNPSSPVIFILDDFRSPPRTGFPGHRIVDFASLCHHRSDSVPLPVRHYGHGHSVLAAVEHGLASPESTAAGEGAPRILLGNIVSSCSHDSCSVVALELGLQEGGRIADSLRAEGGFLIVNLSLRVDVDSLWTKRLDAAIGRLTASETNVVVVAAAGNQGPGANSIAFPASLPNVIAVGSGGYGECGCGKPVAVGVGGLLLSSWGIYDGKPDLLAPSFHDLQPIGCVDGGTSLATGFATGVLAQVISSYAGTGADVRGRDVHAAVRALGHWRESSGSIYFMPGSVDAASLLAGIVAPAPVTYGPSRRGKIFHLALDADGIDVPWINVTDTGFSLWRAMVRLPENTTAITLRIPFDSTAPSNCHVCIVAEDGARQVCFPCVRGRSGDACALLPLREYSRDSLVEIIVCADSHTSNRSVRTEVAAVRFTASLSYGRSGAADTAHLSHTGKFAMNARVVVRRSNEQRGRESRLGPSAMNSIGLPAASGSDSWSGLLDGSITLSFPILHSDAPPLSLVVECDGANVPLDVPFTR